MKRQTLGGKRLGSGKQMTVEVEDFGYSSHDLSNVFRSTMAVGTLVPFMIQQALPGDHWDIQLQLDCKTLPTVAPVFGSFKIQADIFSIPMRLYNSWIHNNKLNIGMNMSQVQIPQLNVWTIDEASSWFTNNIAQYPINNANILKYLGISGAGRLVTGTGTNYLNRSFNAIPLLGYWDIFKNYYANKQESNAYVLSTNTTVAVYGVTQLDINGVGYIVLDTTEVDTIANETAGWNIKIDPSNPNISAQQALNETYITNLLTGTSGTIASYSLGSLIIMPDNWIPTANPTTTIWYAWRYYAAGNWYVSASCLMNGVYKLKGVTHSISTNYSGAPQVMPFALSEIDTMRETLLQSAGNITININSWYTFSNLVLNTLGGAVTSQATAIPPTALQRYSQNGLLLKTYQSDIFNNWLNEATMATANLVSNINTSAGFITIDAIELGYKVYRMLNQIAVSGGSYDDWQIAVWNHERFHNPNIPMYCGGLSKELIFNEIWSAAAVQNVGVNQVTQPLGTLAGKGSMGIKHIGGDIQITVNEPSYIMGIVSLTPRLDYSQGNDWATGLTNWDNLHKPHLDEIGFQDLMGERLAWFAVNNTSVIPTAWSSPAIGKQPAWINYMTNFNRNFGQFAEQNNLMCMVVNRRYQQATSYTVGISDITTYIEPNLYNYLFSYTALDAQNYWMQILNTCTVRRKMSAKLMPNL
nr:MAG: major capsid protein [Microviridae sp.]